MEGGCHCGGLIRRRIPPTLAHARQLHSILISIWLLARHCDHRQCSSTTPNCFPRVLPFQARLCRGQLDAAALNLKSQEKFTLTYNRVLNRGLIRDDEALEAAEAAERRSREQPQRIDIMSPGPGLMLGITASHKPPVRVAAQTRAASVDALPVPGKVKQKKGHHGDQGQQRPVILLCECCWICHGMSCVSDACTPLMFTQNLGSRARCDGRGSACSARCAAWQGRRPGSRLVAVECCGQCGAGCW